MTNATNIELDIFRWTVEDYHRLVEAGILQEDDSVELINGQILQMSPAGDQHAACIDRLDELFRDILGKSVNIRIQSPVILNDFSEPEPDISVLKRKENFYSDGHPMPSDILLVVEVADTTLAKDRVLKGQAYAIAGISEYWIVNIPEQQVEQYLFPDGETYELTKIYKPNQVITSKLLGEVPVRNILP